jgi:hypothetical protein
MSGENPFYKLPNGKKEEIDCKYMVLQKFSHKSMFIHNSIRSIPLNNDKYGIFANLIDVYSDTCNSFFYQCFLMFSCY